MAAVLGTIPIVVGLPQVELGVVAVPAWLWPVSLAFTAFWVEEHHEKLETVCVTRGVDVRQWQSILGSVSAIPDVELVPNLGADGVEPRGSRCHLSSSTFRTGRRALE